MSGPDLLLQVFSKNNRKRLGNGAGCRSDFLFVSSAKKAVVLRLELGCYHILRLVDVLRIKER